MTTQAIRPVFVLRPVHAVVALSLAVLAIGLAWSFNWYANTPSERIAHISFWVPPGAKPITDEGKLTLIPISLEEYRQKVEQGLLAYNFVRIMNWKFVLYFGKEAHDSTHMFTAYSEIQIPSHSQGSATLGPPSVSFSTGTIQWQEKRVKPWNAVAAFSVAWLCFLLFVGTMYTSDSPGWITELLQKALSAKIVGVRLPHR